MKTRLFLSFLMLGACAAEERVVELQLNDGGPPVRMAPAKAASTDFLRAYQALCLKNFPSHADMRIAARKLGFRIEAQSTSGIVGEPIDVGFYRNRSLDLTAVIGTSSLFWDGIDSGGSITFQVCQVRGHVTDPQNLTASNVRRAFNSDMTFAADDREGKDLRGAFKNSEREGAHKFRLPYMYTVKADSYVIGADRCGALPRCRVWREAEFTVDLPLN